MNAHLADAWWFWIAQAGWQSAVVGGVLLAVVAFGKRWPAPVRCAILVVSLLKFAMPPLWSAPTGLFSHWTVANHLASAVRTGRDPRADQSFHSDSDRPPIEYEATVDDRATMRDQPSSRAEGANGKPSSREAATAPWPTEPIQPRWHFATDWWLKTILMFLHLVGACGILAWVATEFRSIRRIIAHSGSIEAGPVYQAVERLRDRFALGRSVRVLISSEIAAPMAMGVWRPTVVLPESAEGLAPRQLEAVLVHELTHLRRGDAWLAWLQVVLCAAWWFHPVIWLVNRSLRRVREDCCDDAILLAGIATGSEYCDMLLRVAQEATARRTGLLACQMADRLHPLGNRMRRIMDGRVRRSSRMSLTAAAIVAALACVVLPGLGESAQIPGAGSQVAVNTQASGADARKGLADRSSPEDPFAKRVRESMMRARTYLAGTQNQDGSFSGFSNNESAMPIFAPGGRPQPPPGANQIVGTTSLAVLALLSSGMSPDDPVILKGVEFLRKSPPPARLFCTYQSSLKIAALVAAKQIDHDRERIAALVRALADSQIKTGYQSGMWSYEPFDDKGHADNSNTEFAILGLSAGESAGVVIDRTVWARTADHFVDLQNKDGGWGYHNSASSTGSMTASAIASLEICRQQLAATQHPRLSACEIAIKRGLAWQDRYFQAGANPGQGSNWLMLYWVQIARSGRLTGRKRFGKHEWFREIADFALQAQTRSDGTWKAWGSPESNPRLGTSFVLLFLGDGLPGDNRGPASGAK
jgi:beta-lactamase regulating signal transducer with metallopeptidase domain